MVKRWCYIYVSQMERVSSLSTQTVIPQTGELTTIMKCNEEGGLHMTDFTLFDKAFKLCWVKRLGSSHDSPWMIVPNALLSNLGAPLLFRCNYDTKYVVINEQLPKFYKDIISFWQDLNVTAPQQKKETLNQIIWNN